MSRVLLCALCLVAATHAGAQAFVFAYTRGEKAADAGDWNAVKVDMQKALSSQSESSSAKRLRGTISQPYLPHHYLGLALSNLGDCNGAERQFSNPSSVQALRELGDGKAALQATALADCRRRTAPPSPTPAPIASTPKPPSPAPTPIASTPKPPSPSPPIRPNPAPVPAAPSSLDVSALRNKIADANKAVAKRQAELANPLLAGSPERSQWTAELGQIEASLREAKSALAAAEQGNATRRAAGESLADAAIAKLRTSGGAIVGATNDARQAQVARTAQQDTDSARAALTQAIAEGRRQLTASQRVAELEKVVGVAESALAAAERTLSDRTATSASLVRAATAIERATATLSQANQQRAALASVVQRVRDQVQRIRTLSNGLKLLPRDRSLGARALTLAEAAQAALDSKDAERVQRLEADLTAATASLEKAAVAGQRIRTDLERLRPMVDAYLKGNFRSVLQTAVPVSSLAPEAAVQFYLLRAAARFGNGDPAAEVDIDLSEAAKLKSDLLGLPDQAFPPAFVRQAAALGLR